MNDLSKLINRLTDKTQKLGLKSIGLSKENEQLFKEIENLKLEITKKNQHLKELQDKNNLLKIAGSVEKESTKDVKLKINEMVREIDKCIAQIADN